MLKNLVLKNRSYRGYDHSRTVSRDELLALVDLARVSASSVNLQPLKYRLVYTSEETARVQQLTRWAAALPQLDLPYTGSEPTAFIVICVDQSITENTNMFLRDIGIAAQTILLGAVETGLGGCMIGNFDKVKLSSTLALPENVVPNLVIAIGKPDEEIVLTEAQPGESVRYYRDASGKTHYVPKRSLDEIIL